MVSLASVTSSCSLTSSGSKPNRFEFANRHPSDYATSSCKDIFRAGPLESTNPNHYEIQMPLTRIEDAILVAAYFRGRDPSAQIWSSNSDQVLTLSLFYTGDISYDDCASRFDHRPYIRSVYDEDGKLNEQIHGRYKILIHLIEQRPDLIEGGGDLRTPADPTYTACGLTFVGCQLARTLKTTFPQKPEFPNWPDRQVSADLV